MRIRASGFSKLTLTEIRESSDFQISQNRRNHPWMLKRRLTPELCVSTANLQFSSKPKIKGIILRPSERYSGPKISESAASPKSEGYAESSRFCTKEYFGERVKPILKGGLFTGFQIAIRKIRSPHRLQEARGAQRLHRMDTARLTFSVC